MSEQELAGAAAFLLAGLALLVPALRYAARVLPRGERVVARWPLAEAFAVLAAPFLVLAVVRALLPPAAEGAAPQPPPDGLEAVLLSQLVLGSAGVVAVVLAARRAGGLASLGFGPRFPPTAFGAVLLAYLPGLLCVSGVMVVWARVCEWLGWETEQEAMRLILALQGRELAIAAFVAVLFGPLIEELVFRGFLQGFLERFAGRPAALAITALLFASLHGMAGLPLLLALSVFLGWLQQRTRCLWVPWLAHALHNAVSLGIALGLRPR